jgi:23S rRNA G2069 N7-methylase RlmK/C1962 C5-methylase RlmI
MDADPKRQEQAEMLINRLKKNRRRLLPWARKENLTCYRIYDRDIPEIPLAVDWYDGRLHVALYERDGADAEAQAARTGRLVQEAAASLGVPADSVYIKFRRRAAGGTQYKPVDAKGRLIEVQEAGLTFLVNLTDYVDTGLFLDHRILRRMVMQSAKGKRVLNLFAYTGAFSVYAAVGGARSVTTADLSNTYLDWAKKNMSRNGFLGGAYRYVREDLLRALGSDDLKGPYDLVVLDPPTVSKSKAMDRDLDIQRDHPLLLNAVLRRTAPCGTVFFSNNLKKFKLQPNAVEGADIVNISDKTRPFDFRSPFVHHSFRLTKHG